MPLLDELSPASFKDASFLISTSSINGGRKDQRHEFPNSDKQTIEDLGLLPRVYNVVGWIAEPNYIDKRDKLLSVLESNSSGVLTHPFYGQIENVKARTYVINENLSDLGRAEISMVFEIDNSIGTPIESQNTLSLLNNTNNAAQISVNAEIADNFKVDLKNTGNFQDAQSSLASLSDSYSAASNVIVKQTDSINELGAEISDFGNEINDLILVPQDLADKITSFADTLNESYSEANSKYTVWANLFGFGDTNGEIVPTTSGLVQRKANNDSLNRSIQSQALCYAYLASASISYSNTDELDEIAGQLESQYEKVSSDETLSSDLLHALLNMRENTNLFFDQKRLTLNSVITVRTPLLPARIISYQYYGDSNFGEEIASLNGEADVSFMEGNIEIVTQ